MTPIHRAKKKERQCNCEYGNCHLCREAAAWRRAIENDKKKPTTKKVLDE